MKQKSNFQDKSSYFDALTEPPKPQKTLPAPSAKKTVVKAKPVVEAPATVAATEVKSTQPEMKKPVSVRLPASIEGRMESYWIEQRMAGNKVTKDQIVTEALEKFLPPISSK